VAGADANFRFFRNLNLNAMVAKAMTPEAVVDPPAVMYDGGEALAYRGTGTRHARRVHADGLALQRRSSGSFRAPGSADDVWLGCTCDRPAIPKWLREFFPHYQIVNITREDGGAFARGMSTTIFRSRCRTGRSSEAG